jgi:hypothetical protein
MTNARESGEFDQKQLEAAARRYLAKVSRRSVPGVLLIAVAVAIIAFLPPVGSSTDGASTASPQFSGDHAGGGAATSGAASGTTTTTVASPTNTQPLGAQASSATQAAPSAGAVTAASPVNPQLAVSGVTCGPGVRQVTWSKYSPLCVPAFHGNNGGATSPGVTSTTITVTYRETSSAEASAVEAAAGQAAGGTDSQYIADLQTYINFFNKQFELYGRHVVLEPFMGQGDPLEEDQGQDLSGAQADAVTAKDDGSFGDLSILSMTQPYAEDLAEQGVLSFGVPYMSQQWFDQFAPYAYSYWPTDTSLAQFEGSLICQRMAGLPASFAGDSDLQGKTRVFGLIVPENPVYAAGGNLLQSELQACGIQLADRVNYALDISTIAEQSENAIAQMRAAGVTTILCSCDPIAPIFLTNEANTQDYHPEWVSLWWGDAYGRDPNQTEWAHAMASGGASPAASGTEAYRAFKLADPSGTPAEMYYNLPYLQALMLFDGLQAAGPDLTPTTFARGFFSLPPSLPGADYGPWTFGQGIFTPQQSFQIGWWSPTATSAYDGKQGAWENCNGGTWYPAVNPSLPPLHTQLQCFGQ